jgi:hypothetical protein
MVCSGTLRYVIVRSGMLRYGTVRYGTVRYVLTHGAARHDLARARNYNFFENLKIGYFNILNIDIEILCYNGIIPK